MLNVLAKLPVGAGLVRVALWCFPGPTACCLGRVGQGPFLGMGGGELLLFSCAPTFDWHSEQHVHWHSEHWQGLDSITQGLRHLVQPESYLWRTYGKVVKAWRV